MRLTNLKFHTESVHDKYDSWLKEQLLKGLSLDRLKSIIELAIEKNNRSKSADIFKSTLHREILSLKQMAIDRAFANES